MKASNLVLAALVVFSISAQAEVVGRVLMTAGNTYAIRNEQELRLIVGSPVENKDTLKTGPASNMQVRFTDESIVSMRDQSLLKIEDFNFSGKQDGLEKAFFDLIKGGFRTVTGLIGKTNKTTYAVKTPTSTIGIRGTNYALLICSAGSCGADAKDGVYGGVSEGIISHTNKVGESQFGSGDYFYSSSPDLPAHKLIGPPSFFADKLAGQKRGGKPGGGAPNEGNQEAKNGDASSDSRPNNVTPPTPQQTFIVTENKLPSGAPAVVPPVVLAPSCSGSLCSSGSPLPSGTGYVAAVSAGFGTPPVNSIECSPDCFTGTGTVLFDANRGAIAFLNANPPTFYFIKTGTQTVVQGATDGGVIGWGVWAGGVLTAGGFFNNQTIGPGQGLHYIVGIPTSSTDLNFLATNISGLNRGFTATYAMIGFTNPTFSDGIGAGLGTGAVSGNLTINFALASVKSAITLAFAGNNSIALNGSAFLSQAGFTGSFNAIQAGPKFSGSSAPASVNGFVAGTNATRAGLVYQISPVPAAGSSFVINGSTAFTQSTLAHN